MHSNQVNVVNLIHSSFLGNHALYYRGAVVWNSIQPSTRNDDSVKAFKAGYCRSALG